MKFIIVKPRGWWPLGGICCACRKFDVGKLEGAGLRCLFCCSSPVASHLQTLTSAYKGHILFSFTWWTTGFWKRYTESWRKLCCVAWGIKLARMNLSPVDTGRTTNQMQLKILDWNAYRLEQEYQLFGTQSFGTLRVCWRSLNLLPQVRRPQRSCTRGFVFYNPQIVFLTVQ